MLGVEVRYLAEDGSDVGTTLGALDVDRVCRALPVRRIPSYTGQRHYAGLFWSASTGGHVPYESRLELDRLWLADFDPQVSWIAAQPLWLAGRDGDAVRRHVPDLLLSRAGRPPLLVDVKPAEFADQPKVRAVFAWTSRLCAARGWDYEVWTGANSVRLANVRMLALGRRLRGRIRRELLLALTDAARTGMTLEQLIATIDAEHAADSARLAVLALLWEGVWTVDMDQVLSGASQLAVEGIAA